MGEVRPDIAQMIIKMSRIERHLPVLKDDEIRYMKIEREGRIILIVNSDRKRAQGLGKRKFGLRDSASLLTRYTGPFAQALHSKSSEIGQFTIDYEMIQSFAEDIENEFPSGAAPEDFLEVSVNSHEMFTLREESNHTLGPSFYVRTNQPDLPEFQLNARQILFAYASTILNNADNDGTGMPHELPQGFHAILPLLHQGEWSEEELAAHGDVIDAAADFVLNLFLWPSNPIESDEPCHRPKGKNDSEVVVFYEEDSAAWEVFVSLVEWRFDTPIVNQEFSPGSLDLLSITGMHDEHTYLQNHPYVTNPLPNADLSPYWGNNAFDILVDDMFRQVSDWAKLVRGETNPPTYVLNWANIDIGHVNQFISWLDAAEKIREEIDVVEVGEDNDAIIFKEMDYRTSTSEDNQPNLWISLMRMFSSLQMALFYCSTFKILNKDLPTLTSTYITYSGYERRSISESDHELIERTVQPDILDRPLTTLVDFIMDNKGENFDVIVEELRKEGIEGDDCMVIYEHMISRYGEDDFEQDITRLVPWKKIQERIIILGGCEFTHAQQEKAVNELLRLFGYPILAIDKPDIGALQSRWNSELADLPLSETEQCLIIANKVTREIEWYLRVCVKGTIREYAKSVETNEKMKSLLDAQWYDIGKRNLGQLVNIDLFHIMCKFVEDEEYIKQQSRDKLVSARNKFGHPGEETPHISLEEANTTLKTYLESAMEYISWIEKSSLSTPIPVVIKSVKSTEHGYYEIKALKSSGEVELIYMPLGTDKEFKIGETWYVIPYSNPIRIEPLMFQY